MEGQNRKNLANLIQRPLDQKYPSPFLPSACEERFARPMRFSVSGTQVPCKSGH